MKLASPIACTNTKADFGREQLFDWLDQVIVPHTEALARLSFFACLPHPLLMPASEHLHGTGVRAAAQDCAAAGQTVTGAVTADLLAELGCHHVMLGHAERRRVFDEDDTLIAGKVEAAAAAGLTALVCVGENQQLPAHAAARHVAYQTQGALARLDHHEPIMILYEPAWAIGSQHSADPRHTATVLHALRAETSHLNARFLYGGAVLPGTYTALRAEANWDGVAIGRAARDAGMLAEVTAELLAATPHHHQPSDATEASPRIVETSP